MTTDHLMSFASYRMLARADVDTFFRFLAKRPPPSPVIALLCPAEPVDESVWSRLEAMVLSLKGYPAEGSRRQHPIGWSP